MESTFLLTLHRHATPSLDALFRVSHAMGAPPFCAALVLGATLWHVARGERREALTWLAAGLATWAWLELLKGAVARPRPELWPRLVARSGSGFSFPSGHALASATFYPLLAWSVSRLLRRSLAPFAYGLAVAVSLFVGFGRVYLGVHWPSDVLAGWALGAAQSALAISWLEQSVTRSASSSSSRPA